MKTKEEFIKEQIDKLNKFLHEYTGNGNMDIAERIIKETIEYGNDEIFNENEEDMIDFE